MSQYYSKLKVLWEEMNEHHPTLTYSCEGLRPFLAYLHTEHVLQFLIGLNDEFSQVPGQILMMEPLPLINKVYFVVVQEEHQKAICRSSLGPDLAFVAKAGDAKAKGSKKSHLLCTHYGLHGHSVDKCFKLHGYPPGYKSKSKSNVVN